uniref:peptidylprolyl isomerase n=1 Tax=Guillardia theta TaxID=55529 RepID=A0A7S4KLZ8_GUITH|mmetsp:Transcript_27045/g.88423  ORF Transcript_27045/g.88423 Transcript_27045/m.88423 type:complete len:834 (+) Transcript_27045:89-2590(+)
MKTRDLAVAYVLAVLCCNAIAMEQSQPRYNANRLIGNRNRFLNYKLAVHDVPKALSVMRGGSVYDLEVMKGARDITGDGGVRKLIVSEGVHNEMPVNGDELFVYFNGSLACFDNGTTIVQGKNISGFQFDTSMAGESLQYPRSFVLGSGNTIKGWDIAARTMKRKERARVLVRSDYAYGAKGRKLYNGNEIPPNSTLMFELELLRWNEKDLNNDGGILISYNQKDHVDAAMGWRHPDINDDVLIMYRGMYNGIVFAASDGFQWVRLGEQNLVEGLEEVLTREAVQGGRYLVKLAPEYAYGSMGYHPLVPPNATVQFEIILKNWNSVHDMFGDGSLVVTCLGQPRQPYCPSCKDCCKVNISLEGIDSSGYVFYPLTNLTDVVIGNRDLPETIENALSFVKEGQRARIFVGREHSVDDMMRFPFGQYLQQDVTWEVVVHSVARSYKLTLQERLQAARIRKQWGNELIKNNRTQEALIKYDLSFDALKTVKDHQDASDMLVIVHLNRAACYRQLARGDFDYRNVIAECDAALNIKASCVKALFRRGQANLKLGNLVEANHDVKKCLELEPNNTAAKKLQVKLRAQQQLADKQSRQVFSKMMGGKDRRNGLQNLFSAIGSSIFGRKEGGEKQQQKAVGKMGRNEYAKNAGILLLELSLIPFLGGAYRLGGTLVTENKLLQPPASAPARAAPAAHQGKNGVLKAASAMRGSNGATPSPAVQSAAQGEEKAAVNGVKEAKEEPKESRKEEVVKDRSEPASASSVSAAAPREAGGRNFISALAMAMGGFLFPRGGRREEEIDRVNAIDNRPMQLKEFGDGKQLTMREILRMTKNRVAGET